MKKQLIFLLTILLCFFPVLRINSDSTTFPTDKAGIAAYIKIDSLGPDILNKAWGSFNSLDENKETHVIGTISMKTKIEGESGRFSPEITLNPYIYVDLDGWMVAYYLNDDMASKIMHWSDYEPGFLEITTLNKALEIMKEKLEVSYLTDIKYYHFGYPQANKMALVVERVIHPGQRENSFSVTIPGIVHSASYSFFSSLRTSYTQYPCSFKIEVDDNEVFGSGKARCEGGEIVYGEYDLDLLLPNIPHLIKLSISASQYLHISAGWSSLFIYEV